MNAESHDNDAPATSTAAASTAVGLAEPDARGLLATDLASSPITISHRWAHAYGEMLIETRANGTVWINGQLVRDTALSTPTTENSSGRDAP